MLEYNLQLRLEINSPINDINDRFRQRIVTAGAGAGANAGIAARRECDPCGLRALYQGERHDIAGCPSSHRSAEMSTPSMVKHSVRVAGHATSVSLERAFWEALSEIAAQRHLSLNALLSAIDAERSGNLSSAIRLFVLECCRRGELRDGDEPGSVPRS
jgi:predicted DNA-binding ribbon-helix-helix protein